MLVADTYNHKIKGVNTKENILSSWCGSGERKLADGAGSKASFNEPTGIAYSVSDEPGEKKLRVYVADCNNSCVRLIDYNTGEVTTPELKDVPPIVKGGEDLECGGDVCVFVPGGKKGAEEEKKE